MTGSYLPPGLLLPVVLMFAVGQALIAADVPRNASTITSNDSIDDGTETHDLTKLIDTCLTRAWQQAGIEPSGRCDDETFVRRIYLDLIGRIPTMAERAEFLEDTRDDKRERRIDALLASSEYSRHMAEVFDAMLLGRGNAKKVDQREKHGWNDYLTEAFATNRPWNTMARDMVMARVNEGTDIRAGWYLFERRNAHQEIAEAVAPAFFGIRIECAQCHDHPLASEIQQEHYWGLVAFFNRGENQNTPQGPRVIEKATGGAANFTDLAGDSHPMVLTFFESPVVDEPSSSSGNEESDDDYVQLDPAEPRVPKFSRRQQFADQILEDHPLLARSFVNRMWALLIGQGIVHPHDRMDSMHEATNAELLDGMTEDFQTSGYNIQRLVRHIVRSRCYQLESQPASEQALPGHFAYGITKLLTAESLLRSIDVALGLDPSETDSELLQTFRETFPDVLPEEPRSTVAQALFLTNHESLNRRFRAANSSTLADLLKQSDPQRQIDGAFLASLGRHPTPEELQQVGSFYASRETPEDALGQVMWALVTSSEFRVNH